MNGWKAVVDNYKTHNEWLMEQLRDKNNELSELYKRLGKLKKENKQLKNAQIRLRQYIGREIT